MFNVIVLCLVLIIVNGEFHEVGFDEIVDFTVHDGINIGGLVVRAVVLYPTVIKDIGTDLTAPLDFLLARLDLRLSL